MMKISLFIKPLTIKVCFSFVLILSIVSIPSQAQAGFFSDLVNKLNPQAQGSEVVNTQDEVTHNSQTVPLLEPTISQDPKSALDDVPVSIVSDDALAPNTSPLGVDSDLEKYATTAKINVYVVKKGDTLKSIAKQFKVPESTITSSNSDIKKAELIKVGQTLVILPLKTQSSDKQDKAIAKKEDLKKKADVDSKADKVVSLPKTIAQAPVVPVVVTPQTVAPIVDSSNSNTPDNVPNTPQGQPAGTINGGYIWPFPAGTGRVSQGIHADQAYDFAAPTGTPIYAISNGTVLIAHPTGYNGGYGKYVVINFADGRQAIFGHMSKVIAEEGDVVKQGDLIGYVGSTGHSTGPHVHIGFHGTLGNPYAGLKVNSTDIVDNND
jgi:murein DD-endopeptidase MepM/ murein hydrolase activator NlpD